MIFDKDHYALMENFERNYAHLKLAREPKELWKHKTIYECGETNNLFLAYRIGYAYGISKGSI